MKIKGLLNEKKSFVVSKDLLESMVLCHIFSHLNNNNVRTVSAGNGFADIKERKDGSIVIDLEYHTITDYKFEDGSTDHFNSTVQYTLDSSNEYSKKDCEEIAKELYLKSPNDVAFILKVLNPEIVLK